MGILAMPWTRYAVEYCNFLKERYMQWADAAIDRDNPIANRKEF